jgi:hypothetical protein
MTFVRQAGAAAVLVTLTLCLQCAGMAALIAWARGTLKPEVHRLGPFRFAHGAIHNDVHCLAPIRNSALGGVLSLVLFSIAGICLSAPKSTHCRVLFGWAGIFRLIAKGKERTSLAFVEVLVGCPGERAS